MKTKTVYISDDDVEFETEENCKAYEDVLAKMVEIEQKHLGARPESASMTADELKAKPVLESYAHKPEEVIGMFNDLAELLSSLDESVTSFLQDAMKYVLRITPEERTESAAWWEKATFKLKLGVFMWMKKLEPKGGRCDMQVILKRLCCTSPLSGIEYPESKWTAYEQDFERYVKEQKKYRENGCKYTN